jgi:predicted TIM-barrel fold metal-dependent hydrolase
MSNDQPRLPIKFGPASNGEYLPYPKTSLVRETERRAFELADVHARRLGMDRRRFLQTMCGAATALFALAACSKDQHRATASSGAPTSAPGGTFRVPTTATTEPEAARAAIGGDEFVFDVQTHLLDYTSGAPTGSFASGFPYASCGEPNSYECFGLDHWFEEIFVRSDTSMAVISAVPILSDPNPLSIAVMERAKDAARRVCGDGRVFMQGQVNPNVGELNAVVDGMRALRAEHEIVAWKAYTHVPLDRGWFLDDHDAASVQCGHAFLDAVRDLGPKIVCVHKGLGGGASHSSPEDIGAAAKANPDISFVVYHSGYDGPNEGAYTDATANVGVNRLITSLRRAGVGTNQNVYAELGSTWWNAMRDPTQAAHVVGKLLKYVGTDRVVWGTDSIWYGSPQDQVQAFRAFEISEEFQDLYGYPALTSGVKRKIFGQTSAKLYGLDPAVAKCDATPREVEELRASLPASTTYGPTTAQEVRALIDAHGGLI